jgi:1-phosphofructokinase
MTPTTPHIYTLTGNLLAERTLEFRDWTVGAVNRADRESFQVGGKGINVSKMLNRLGVANTALCFVGGNTGAECEAWLRERGFAVQAFTTSGPTRFGTVVRASGSAETTFLGADVSPDAAALRACCEYLDAQPGGQVLALCGSFPGWLEPHYEPLRDALARWLSRGCLVADTYGPPLAWLAGQPLELLKVNAAELRTIGIDPVATLSVAALRYVVTDGPNPVRLREGVTPETTLVPPRVREISATGSGDVLLACVLDRLFRHRKSLREAVAAALPYAAANAAHPTIAEFPEPAPRI